jgi:2-dehydro-3-deoxyphosphogluconate aldolase / (4S)-4-hydroxy-2-oxoglutarate aldolase
LPPPFPLPAEIVDSRLVAVLRAPIPDHVAEAARRLSSWGVRCIEVTLTTPGALGVIEELAGRTGSEVIGAGTVITGQDAMDAISAGATYLLSPLFAPDVLEVGIANGVPVIPGAATPTEIAAAWRSGSAAVKVFPATSLGGPAFIRSVREPLPDIALVPTGGIGEGDVAEYLKAGAIAVGVGSPLTGSSLTSGDFSGLEQRARAFLGATQREREHR